MRRSRRGKGHEQWNQREDGVIVLRLTRNAFSLIDLVDVDIARHCWSCSNWGYARRMETSGSQPRTIFLHRLVLERILGRTLQPGEECDHLNGDRLDNRRCNLRLATSQENKRNQGVRSDNTSGARGVSWDKKTQRWRAYIHVGGKFKALGHFLSYEEAIAARRNAELEMFGSFAPEHPINGDNE